MTRSPATHACVPPLDPFSLPLLNAFNVATLRAHYGMEEEAS
jgi:hypothetical protein